MRLATSTDLSAWLRTFFLLSIGVGTFDTTAGIALASNIKIHLREIQQIRLPAPIIALDIAAGSDLTAAALGGRRVRVWRLETGQLVHEFSFPEPETDPQQKNENEAEPMRVRFAPDGKTLAVSYLSRIYLYDVSTWREVCSLGVDGENEMRPLPRPELRRRPKGEKLKPGRTLTQMAQDWIKLRSQGDGRTRITDFVLTADGLSVLAAYCRGSCYDRPEFGWSRRDPNPSGRDPVRLWDIRTRQLLWERVYDSQGVVERVVPSPNGAWFLAANRQIVRCAIQLHDLKSGQLLFSLPPSQYTDAAPPIFFTPDSRHFITFCVQGCLQKKKDLVSWQQLAMYESSDGRRVGEFSRGDGVHWSDLSNDGGLLVATTWYGREFKLWDVQSGKIVAKRIAYFGFRWFGAFVDRVRFTADGKHLVVANDGRGLLAVYAFEPSSDRTMDYTYGIGWKSAQATDLVATRNGRPSRTTVWQPPE